MSHLKPSLKTIWHSWQSLRSVTRQYLRTLFPAMVHLHEMIFLVHRTMIVATTYCIFSASLTGVSFFHNLITYHTNFCNPNSVQVKYEMFPRHAPIKYKSYHGATQSSKVAKETIMQKSEILPTQRRSEGYYPWRLSDLSSNPSATILSLLIRKVSTSFQILQHMMWTIHNNMQSVSSIHPGCSQSKSVICCQEIPSITAWISLHWW